LAELTKKQRADAELALENAKYPEVYFQSSVIEQATLSIWEQNLEQASSIDTSCCNDTTFRDRLSGDHGGIFYDQKYSFLGETENFPPLTERGLMGFLATASILIFKQHVASAKAFDVKYLFLTFVKLNIRLP
jgi:hypothetical protein